MNANILQSCAVLEEFLNEKYVGIASIDDMTDSEENTPVEKLNSFYHDWFYNHGSYNYVIYEYNYTENGESKTDYLTVYLINKKGLSKSAPEITSQLKGGDANNNDDNAYMNFQDVYGVTSDLKVFYCSNGLDGVIGANYANSEKFDSTKTIYPKDSGIAKAVSSSLGLAENQDINLKTLRSVKELTIKDTDGVSDLSALYDFTTLNKLTLENFKGSLSGIEYAKRLTYIFFDNSKGTQDINYEGLKGVTGLRELYCLMPTNSEVEKMCTEMSDTDYLNLSILGLYGYKHPFDVPDYVGEIYDAFYSTLTDISCLDKLTTSTKQHVSTLYLENNALTNLDGIQNFTKVTGLLAQMNKFSDISALSGLTSLVYLKLYNCGTNLTSLSSLDNLTKLKDVHLTRTTGIRSLKELITNDKSLDRLYASDLENLDFTENTEFWTEENRNKLGKISVLNLSPKYAMLFLNTNSLTLATTNTDEEFKLLKDNNSITTLSLNDNKNVTDATLQSILPTLKKLTVLNANGSNLASLNWCLNVKDKTLLNMIDIRGTSINSILPLQGFTGLRGIIADGSNLTLYYENNPESTQISTDIINSLYPESQVEVRGFEPCSENLCRQIEKLTNLTKFGGYWRCGPNYDMDLSNTKLTKFGYRFRPVPVWPNTSLNVKLPDTIEKVCLHAVCNLTLSSTKNLVEFWDTWSSNTLKILKDEAEDGQIFLGMNGSVSYNINRYDALLTSKIKELSFYCTNYNEQNRPLNIVEMSSLTGLTSCTKMTFGWATFPDLDGAKFPKSVTDLTIYDCKLNNFKNLNQMTALKNLSLYNNLFSDLSDFNDLSADCALEILNLNNNALQNITSVLKDGQSSSLKTCSILSKLKKLKSIDLGNNVDLNDFEPLTSVGYKDDGKHKFTRTVN